MPFLLARGAKNIITEVQRWQYFLLVERGITAVGSVDGGFGSQTEQATKLFQMQNAIPTTGKLDAQTLSVAQNLGYTVKPDDYYDKLIAQGFPKKPSNLSSPTNAARNKALTCFKFKQLAKPHRHDPDGIVITSSCDGSVSDWENKFIIRVAVPGLAHLPTFSGFMRAHSVVAPHLVALFDAWAQADLMHLFLTYEGAFVARYIRGGSPSDGAHGIKESKNVGNLSNHAFGSAFDVNATWNMRGTPSALPGEKGCV
jgi:Putative peptidoglycan binding domain